MQKKPGTSDVQVNIARTFVRIFRREIVQGLAEGRLKLPKRAVSPAPTFRKAGVK